MSRARTSRERGATYTLMILTVASGLLIAGAALTDASRHTFQVAAEDGRRLRAREAALAGVRWAAAAAKAAPGQPVAGELELEGAKVAVRATVRAEDGALLVTSAVDLPERALRLDAVLAREGDGYRLDDFELTAATR